MEISEPERTRARYQAVLSALLAPGQDSQLWAYGPLLARLQLGATSQRGVPVMVCVVRAAGDDAKAVRPRLQQLVDELLKSRHGAESQSYSLRIIVVTQTADAAAVDAELRALCAEAPPSPALQAFVVGSDGAVRSSTSLTFSEVGRALREQAKQPLSAEPESEPEFAARCQQAVAQTQARFVEARDYGQELLRRRTPVTYGLLLLNAALFGLSYLWGGSEAIATLGRMGAAAPSRILGGEWWRLLAATALHSGVAHILLNSLMLWNLGILLERILGPMRLLTLYVLSGLVGNLLGTALAGLLGYGSSVGASGAVCGMLAACAALGLRPRGDLPVMIAQNLKRMALINLGLTLLGSLRPQVDWRAHLGGTLVGALLVGSGFLRPITRLGQGPDRERNAGTTVARLAHGVLGALAAALLLGSVGLGLVRGQPWLLTQLDKRERIAIEGTTLSLEVPRALGRGHKGTTADSSTSMLFDDPLQAMVALVITAVPHEQPLPEPADRQRYADAEWPLYSKAARDSAHDVVIRALTVGGLPTLELRRELPTGGRVRRLLQVRAGYLLALQLHVPAGLSARQIPDLSALLATATQAPP